MTKTQYWLEVLVVVIVGAGKPRRFKGIGTTKPLIWSDHQDIITQHLQRVEKMWDVKVVHGRKVGQYWRDFILCTNKCKDLSGIPRPGDELPVNIHQQLEQIWTYAKQQTLTRDYATIIYTDAGPSYYYPRTKGDDSIQASIQAESETWFTHRITNLSRNISLIFPEGAALNTTAHELGHQVGGGVVGGLTEEDLPHGDESEATTHARKIFYGGRYVRNDPPIMEKRPSNLPAAPKWDLP